MFFESEPNLKEYIVKKVNTRSFYAHRKDSDYVRRFDKKTMVHSSLGNFYKAYLTEKDYWDKVQLHISKMAKRLKIFEKAYYHHDKSLLKTVEQQQKEIERLKAANEGL